MDRQELSPNRRAVGRQAKVRFGSVTQLTLQRGIDMIRDVAEADTASSPTRPLGAGRNPGERLGSY
jgi:hypothetical protein